MVGTIMKVISIFILWDLNVGTNGALKLISALRSLIGLHFQL
jgi:hypothetical protein